MAAKLTRSGKQQTVRDAQRKWLDNVVAQTGLSLTEIARRGKLTPSTLTRFRNNDVRAGTLHPITLAAVTDVTGIPFLPDEAARTGFRDREAEPYKAEPEDELAGAVAALLDGYPNRYAYSLRVRSLEHVGFRPGDVLIVDLNGVPQAGDTVCAQLYDFEYDRAETVFRLYEPPFLIASGPDESFRHPRRADEGNVGLKGVVVASLRR